MLVARKSSHIQEDIKRNFSSWNFGEEGLNCSEEQLELWKEQAINENSPFFISGFEFWGNEIANLDIRELYPNYWVLVDNENARGGISGIKLNSNTLENAIIEANDSVFCGDGICFDASTAVLLYSNNEIHIFETN